jgi:hypothetical protein
MNLSARRHRLAVRIALVGCAAVALGLVWWLWRRADSPAVGPTSSRPVPDPVGSVTAADRPSASGPPPPSREAAPRSHLPEGGFTTADLQERARIASQLGWPCRALAGSAADLPWRIRYRYAVVIEQGRARITEAAIQDAVPDRVRSCLEEKLLSHSWTVGPHVQDDRHTVTDAFVFGPPPP